MALSDNKSDAIKFGGAELFLNQTYIEHSSLIHFSSMKITYFVMQDKDNIVSSDRLIEEAIIDQVKNKTKQNKNQSKY